MTYKKLFSLVLPGLCLAGWLHSPAAGAADDHAAHRHDDHATHGASGGLALNNGAKWHTDAPLRRGMGNIRALVERHHRAGHGDEKATPPVFADLAKGIQNETNYIFRNCKLDKQADEVLHVILADILGGAAAMESGQKGQSREQGMNRVVSALNGYGRTFDHPGWKPLN